MKKCTHCGKEKEDAEFYPDQRKKDGLSSWCKECTRNSSRTRKWELKNYTPRDLIGKGLAISVYDLQENPYK